MGLQANHTFPAGTTLSYGSATGSETISLSDLVAIAFPGVEHGESNDTNLASANAVGQSSAGWGKPQKLPQKLYLTGSQYAALLTIRQARSTMAWKFQLPLAPNQSSTGDKSQFSAWIAKLQINPAEQMKDEKYQYDLDLQQTGDETYTVGS